MRTTAAIMAVLVTAGLSHLARCDEPGPPLRVVDGLFDLFNLKTLGLKTIPGEHVWLYRANEETGIYSHHPGLAVFQGNIYCSWTNGIVCSSTKHSFGVATDGELVAARLFSSLVPPPRGG